MSRKKREFPPRILVADIAHPRRNEVILEMDWGDVPTAFYVLAEGLRPPESE
jgi:hypothetical protein